MLLLALRYRNPAWVVRADGFWVQRYRGGTLVSPHLRSVPFRVARTKTEDLFFYRYKPKPGDVVVELGAELGSETLFLSRAVGASGRVIAVEAHPDTVRALRRMVELNQLTNVDVVHAAVGAESGETTISDGDAVSNTVGRGALVVPAVSLEDLFQSANIGRVDLLKVNIEGAEGPLLRAMTAQAAGVVRSAVISCHDFRAAGNDADWYRTGESVDRELKRLNFCVDRRPSDPRPWVRDYRYATAEPAR